MKIDIITIFPPIFDSQFEYGIISQGINKGLVEINVHDLRDWSNNKQKQVDDRPFGGGAGMILMAEPVFKVVKQLRKDITKVIYMSPKGKTLNQSLAEDLSELEHIIILCGRYEGIDQRIIDELVDYEISIGDYVLSGGEPAAVVLVDAMTRLIPGVIKNNDFNESESFSDKSDRDLLDYPQYTRPFDYKGIKVPEVLISGNHEKIKKWRDENRFKKQKPAKLSQDI